MHNTIEACKRARARLIFFDNVYMYGRVEGPMTEETPFNPCSKKGEIRAAIATNLLDEIKAGALTALIARSADFYGPAARNSVANMLVIDKLASGRRAMCLVNAHLPHSYTYTPDAAKSLILLAKDERAWNQTWHLPTAANPPSAHEFIGMAAEEFGLAPKYSVLSPPLLWIAGLFDGNVRSSNEMLYQNRFPYLFNSEKFNRRFEFSPTPYTEGIRMTAAAYRNSR